MGSSDPGAQRWPRFRKVLVLSYGPRATQLSESMATPRGPTEVRFKHVPGPGLGAGFDGNRSPVRCGGLGWLWYVDASGEKNGELIG